MKGGSKSLRLANNVITYFPPTLTLLLLLLLLLLVLLFVLLLLAKIIMETSTPSGDLLPVAMNGGAMHVIVS